jgi:hypothetical protein
MQTIKQHYLDATLVVPCVRVCASNRPITTHKTDLMMQSINQGELPEYHTYTLRNWIT